MVMQVTQGDGHKDPSRLVSLGAKWPAVYYQLLMLISLIGLMKGQNQFDLLGQSIFNICSCTLEMAK